MNPTECFGRHDVLTRRDLIARGCSVTEMAAAVHSGRLIRIRRGHYGRPGLDRATERAVRVGGRLTCVSELRNRGIWVAPDERVHVQIAPNAARLRDQDDRFQPLARPTECVLHWTAPVDPSRADRAHVSVVDALAAALGCLPAALASAALDSAAHQHLVTPADLRLLESVVPRGQRRLIGRIDPSAESGLETIVRELAHSLGFRTGTQYFLEGVGHGDVIIEDFVLVETDGAEYHGAEVTTRDRRRDAAFVISGKTVLHFRYAQVMHKRRMVADAIIAAVESHRRIRNSGELAARARRRLERMRFS